MSISSSSILPSGVSAGTADTLLGAGQATPSSAKQAAQQFESLLLAQMLNSVHETESTSLDGNGDGDENSSAANSPVQDMANQQFAQMISQKGGMGLSRLVVEGLEQKSAQAPSGTEKNKV